MNRKICIFVGSRANYSSIKSVMQEIKNEPSLTLQVVLGASALLDRFGRVENLIRDDGFNVDYGFHNIIEGENPTTMAKSTGLGIIEMSNVLANLKPDMVLVVGDRFEVMSVAIAAAYMNIALAHTMGGEVSGTIDESIRHAITKFAHVHFPANDDAKERILKMGERPDSVFNVGCPRLDLVSEELKQDSGPILKSLFSRYGGVGDKEIDLTSEFLLVSQHPVTTEYENNRFHIEQTLQALNEIKKPTIMLWPNIDAGSDGISKGIRTFREKYKPEWLFLFKNLPTHVYIHLMKNTGCLIGNSSSGIREGAFIGTPVVNVGSRQKERNRGPNVIDVGNNANSIYDAIHEQLAHGVYQRSDIYGDGTAGKKICNILKDVQPQIQKTIAY